MVVAVQCHYMGERKQEIFSPFVSPKRRKGNTRVTFHLGELTFNVYVFQETTVWRKKKKKKKTYYIILLQTLNILYTNSLFLSSKVQYHYD